MGRFLTLATAAVVVLPAFAAAASPAGFAPGSLWLSKTDATPGETVQIYTVIYDSSAAPLEGDVIFLADDKEIGGKHFKLAAGETQILSSSWSATTGSHTFSASMKNLSGVSDIAQAQTNSMQITVAPAPPSPIQAAQESITSAISNPTVRSVADAVISTTESARQKGADWLNDQLVAEASSAKSPSPAGKVLGVAILGADSANTAQNKASGALASAKKGLLQGLLYVFQVRWLFYIALLFVFYILFKIVQGLFRYRRRGA